MGTHMFSSMQILMVMSIMVSFEVKGSKSSNKVGGSHTHADHHVCSGYMDP